MLKIWYAYKRPVFEALSANYNNVQFLKVDVDRVSSVSSEAGVRAMPSFFVYKNANKVDQLVGPNEKSLETFIKKYNEEDKATSISMEDSTINLGSSKEKKYCMIM